MLPMPLLSSLTGALALACFRNPFGLSFLAQPRSPMPGMPLKVPVSMRIGMGLLASSCALFG